MGDLLKKVIAKDNINKDSVSREAAKAFYEEYAGVWVFDYDIDNEDLNFAYANFKHFTPKEAGRVFYSGTDKDAGIYGGLINKTLSLDSNQDNLAFWTFAGSYFQQFTPVLSVRANLANTLKNIGGITEVFPFLSAEYSNFTKVKFMNAVTDGINKWLQEENPSIEGLQFFDISQTNQVGNKNALGYQTLIWHSPNSVTNPGIKRPTLHVSKMKNFIDAAERLKLTESSANWRFPTGDDRENEIAFEEDISNSPTVRITLDGVLTDWVSLIYIRFFEQILFQITRFLRTSDFDSLSFSNIQDSFERYVTEAVNRTGQELDTQNLYKSTIRSSQSSGQVGYILVRATVNRFRTKIFEELIKEIDSRTSDETLGDSELNNIFNNAEEQIKTDEAIVGKDTPLEELSEEDIAAKQRFLKQCLLMSRLKELAESHITEINEEEGVHLKMPYRGRLYLIDENLQDEQSSMNKLLIPNSKSINRFMNISTEEHSNLIPKLRFYKVFTDMKGALQQREFTFPKYENSQRINNLSSPGVFDRGSSFGVKEFSFSFEGSTPATSRNDIKANLSLYFQSFEDFIKPRPENGGMSYVELLILPGGKKRGSAITSPLQFDPSYYRIKVDVGWELDSAPNPGIRQSLQKINKSFYLNMIDHDMNIRDDGSVEINVTYRAYMESALKGSTLNALSSRETKKKLEELQKEYNEILATKACTMKQLNQIRAQFLQIEDNLRKANFQSIIRRLLDAGFINNVKVEASSALSFQRTGFLTEKARFESEQRVQNQLLEKSNDQDLNFINTDRVIDQKNSDNQLHINYFYLGDLIYVILDTLYQEENVDINEKYILGSENFKFVLSSFQYLDYFNNNQPTSINMAHIPISVEIFNEWFTENVIKPERTSYPIMYFIRDFTNFLVTEILLENCFKNDLEKTFQFKTSNFLASKNSSSSSTDPLGQLLLDSNTKFLNLDKEYKSGRLPLSSDTNSHIKDMYNYIVIYVDNPRTNTDKSGKKLEDETNGIYHYQIGRPRGILKKIKFSKSDMQYIREARFFRHGHDGLLQLSAVYKVTMEMVGNTLYYPGMELFIDPRGLLGAGSEFDPTQGSLNGEASIANKLGFGGYHIVTRVNSSVGPGKFTTTVDALFSYSGDGDPMSRVLGSKDLAREQKISAIDKALVNERPSQDQKDYCIAEIDRLYKISAGTAYGIDTSNIARPSPPPVETQESQAISTTPLSPLLPEPNFFDRNLNRSNNGEFQELLRRLEDSEQTTPLTQQSDPLQPKKTKACVKEENLEE